MRQDKQKILVVDDDPLSLTAIVNFLHPEAYSIVTAEHGLKAWEMLLAKPEEFCLVIMDRIMPFMSGMELLGNMKRSAVMSAIPVIMLTGVDEKEDIIEAVRAGVFDYLLKPVEKDHLLALVKKALNSFPNMYH